MTRGISTANKNASEGAHYREAYFCKLEFVEGTEFVHIGGRRTYDQSDVEGSGTGTYFNVGGLARVSEIEEHSGLSPAGIELQLSVLSLKGNLLLYSEELETADWSTDGSASVTADQAGAPDGQTTMDQVTGSGTASAGVYQDVTLEAGDDYAVSIFLKAGTSTLSRLALYDVTGSDYQAYVDIAWSSGTPSESASSGASDVTFKEVITGVWRCSFLATADAANTSHRLRLEPDRNGASKDVYAWGAQINEGDALAPYSPTTNKARTTMLSRAQTANIVGRSVSIYRGFLDENWDLVDTAELVFGGWMDDLDIDRQNDLITLRCENDAAVIDRVNPSRYTPEFLKAEYSGDTGFDLIARHMDKDLQWGDLPINGRGVNPFPGYTPPHFLFGNKLKTFDSETEEDPPHGSE